MRTTIDIPEPMLRRAKAEAALRGISLKDYVAEALGAALDGPGRRVAERAPRHGQGPEDDVDPKTGLPVIRGAGGLAMRDLTPQRIHEILEEEEVERALRPADSG